MKKIRINFNGDIGQAIAEIDDLIKQIKDLPQKVAERGAEVTNYGTYPVTVTAENGNIVARGDQVGFAEWGTGVLAQPDSTAPISTGFGTWSDSEDGSKQLTTKGYWYYNKVRYTGTPATMALHYTEDYLKRNAAQIVGENIK